MQTQALRESIYDLSNLPVSIIISEPTLDNEDNVVAALEYPDRVHTSVIRCLGFFRF